MSTVETGKASWAASAKRSKEKDTVHSKELRAGKITRQQELFLDEVMKDLNAVAAAKRAGYSAGSVGTMAANLLNPDIYPLVAKEYQARVALRREECKMEAWRIIQELAAIGFFNPKRLFRNGKKIQTIDQLPDDVAVAIRSMKLVLDKDGNAKIADLQFYSKLDALRMLAEHVGMLRPGDTNVTMNMVNVNWNDLAKGKPPVIDAIEEKLKALENQVPDNRPIPPPPSMALPVTE